MLQDVGVYSAVTHAQTARALIRTTMRKSLKASLKWLKAYGIAQQEESVQMSINYGMPTFWWGQPGVISIGFAWYNKHSPSLEYFKKLLVGHGSGDDTVRVAELDLMYLTCQGGCINKR